MTKYEELRKAYIDGMTAVMGLKDILNHKLLVVQANAWYSVRRLAEQAYYDEWEAANPEKKKALEVAIEEYEKEYADYTDEDWEDNAYYDDYNCYYPNRGDFGYEEVKWPDFNEIYER